MICSYSASGAAGEMSGSVQEGDRSDIVITVYTVHTQFSNGRPRWIGRIRSSLRAEAGDGVDLEEAEFVPAAVLEFLLACLGQ